jgi:hypothetical protein
VYPDQLEFHGEDDMPTSEIEEFAKILVQKVRDAAVQSCDRMLQPSAVSPVAKRWRETIRNGTPETFAKVAIPDIVDETISNLLLAIDQELLRLSFHASSGKSVDLVAEGLGELTGWYRGSDGWCEKHSKERFVDDFSDLKHFFDKP